MPRLPSRTACGCRRGSSPRPRSYGHAQSALPQPAQLIARLFLVVRIARVAVGWKRDDLLEFTLGVGVALEIEIGASELEMMIEIVRLELDRLLEIAHCIVERGAPRHATEHA